MSDGYNIFDAARDLVTGKLEFVDATVAAERMAICDGCEVQNTALKMCTACGCFLPAKVRLKESSCPMELW
jgi:Family of unknown function (DUF6171)